MMVLSSPGAGILLGWFVPSLRVFLQSSCSEGSPWAVVYSFVAQRLNATDSILSVAGAPTLDKGLIYPSGSSAVLLNYLSF